MSTSFTEKPSGALPAGISGPTDITHPTLLPGQFSRPVQQLLIDGATLESLLLQGAIDMCEAEARYLQWVAAVKGLLARVDESDLDDQAKRMTRRTFGEMGCRIRRG